MKFLLWERTDWDSELIDMDTDESVGAVWWEPEDNFWQAEALGCLFNQTFSSQEEAEAMVRTVAEED